MSHAIVYTEHGGPEVLHLIDIDPPVPGAGQLAVRVEAAGVNPIDTKLRAGTRASDPLTAPRRVGRDGAGVVTAVGDEVEGFSVGDEIVFRDSPGAYATDVLVKAKNAVPRPPTVTAAQGASLGIPAGTAYQSLRSLDVRAGDTLLVHAGSGTVGQFAIQFAVLAGATVIATASPRRFERLGDLGAIPVAYGDGLIDRVREAASSGVTVVLDAVGTDEALETSLALVADHARIATLVRGRDADGLGIRAFSGGSPHPMTETQTAWRAEALPMTVALLASGAFTVEDGPSFALADAAEAHRASESGPSGKIVLVP